MLIKCGTMCTNSYEARSVQISKQLAHAGSSNECTGSDHFLLGFIAKQHGSGKLTFLYTCDVCDSITHTSTPKLPDIMLLKLRV